MLILIAVSSTSCKDESDVNGIWIYAYNQETAKTATDSMLDMPTNQIMIFEDGNIESINFMQSVGGGTGDFKIKRPFDFQNSDLKQHYIDFTTISKDSLAITDDYNTTNIYKRLADSLKIKSKIKLTGKTYRRTFRTFVDTIQFISENKYLSSSWSTSSEDAEWYTSS